MTQFSSILAVVCAPMPVRRGTQELYRNKQFLFSILLMVLRAGSKCCCSENSFSCPDVLLRRIRINILNRYLLYGSSLFELILSCVCQFPRLSINKCSENRFSPTPKNSHKQQRKIATARRSQSHSARAHNTQKQQNNAEEREKSS